MLRHHVFELTALEGGQYRIIAFAAGGQSLFKKAFRHDVVFFPAADYMVGEIRAETDCHVAGQRPGGGSPDDKIRIRRINPFGFQQPFVVLIIRI